MSLKQLQQRFQLAVLTGDLQIVDNISSTQPLSASQQMGIYQNAYHERIVAAMKQDFPIIAVLLGESAFASMVHDYIAHYPSHHFNLRYVGKNLSDFLFQKDTAFAAFSDLAKLEYLMCVTDNPDINFESNFNVIDVYDAFHADNQLIELRRIQ